jgi:hypothetical protein
LKGKNALAYLDAASVMNKKRLTMPDLLVFLVLLVVVVVLVVGLKLGRPVAASGMVLHPTLLPGFGGASWVKIIPVPADHFDVGHAGAAVELLDELRVGVAGEGIEFLKSVRLV